VTVIPVIVYFALPESPRWYLQKGRPRAAVDIVNQIIRRAGSRVPPLTLEALGDTMPTAREKLPPYWALFARGQLRWTTVGILSGICAGTAFFLISVLLPKALNDQGFALSASLGLTSIVYAASFFGKGFTGFLMEIIGRRWTIAYALTGSLPGLALMLLSHRAGTMLAWRWWQEGRSSASQYCRRSPPLVSISPSNSRRHCAGVGISSANPSGGCSPVASRRS
jgi:hypothetical protein